MVWTTVFSPHVYSSPASPLSPPVTLCLASTGSKEERGAPCSHSFKIPQHERRQAACSVHARCGAVNQRLQLVPSRCGRRQLPQQHDWTGASATDFGLGWMGVGRPSCKCARLCETCLRHAAATHQPVMEERLEVGQPLNTALRTCITWDLGGLNPLLPCRVLPVIDRGHVVVVDATPHPLRRPSPSPGPVQLPARPATPPSRRSAPAGT